MNSLRRTLAALATATIAAGTLTTLTPAAPSYAGGTSCTERNHRVTYRLGTVTPKIVITQLRVQSVGPGISGEKTIAVGRGKTVSARAKVNGEYSATIGNKLVGQAEVKAGLELEAMGESNQNRTTTVTERIANNTNRNIDYVFFRGTQTVTSGIRQSYCDIDGQDHFGTVAWKNVGTWTSYTFIVEGAPACGRGASNPVTRAALRIGCGH